MTHCSISDCLSDIITACMSMMSLIVKEMTILKRFGSCDQDTACQLKPLRE